MIVLKEIVKEAIKLSFPVMIGYVFLGMAFGILCEQQGYSALWAFFMSYFVYAGSMQFVMLTFFHSGFHLLEAAIVTLTVNARQLFYGLSFLDVFSRMGKKKWYMIFSLTDETYSLLCAIPDQKAEHGKKLMFFISLFDQCYWVIGSVIGAVLGSLLNFDTTGIDFAMTALFTVIFVEQWLHTVNHLPAYIAAFAILISIVVFGFDNFLLPALLLLVIFLLIFEKNVERRKEERS